MPPNLSHSSNWTANTSHIPIFQRINFSNEFNYTNMWTCFDWFAWICFFFSFVSCRDFNEHDISKKRLKIESKSTLFTLACKKALHDESQVFIIRLKPIYLFIFCFIIKAKHQTINYINLIHNCIFMHKFVYFLKLKVKWKILK